MALDLTKPGIGSTGWGAAVNQNFEDIEDEFNSRAWIYLYRTDAFDMSANDTWYDLPWNVASPAKNNVTHDHTSNPEQVTLTKAGTYLIQWEVEMVTGVNATLNTRLLDDGAEVAGSFRQASDNLNSQTVGSVICEVPANSVIELQVGTDNAGRDIGYYENAATLADPDTHVCAAISITRIGP